MAETTTAALPGSTATDDPARSRASVSSDWWTFGGAQGGLVQALSAEAARRAAPGRPLRTITTHFLAAVDERPMQLDATVERATRSSSTVQVRVHQDGALTALSLVGSVVPRASASVTGTSTMPAARPPEDCPPFRGAELLFAFPRHVDIRPVDDVLPLSGSPLPRLTAWVRLRASDVVDASAALVLLDTLAPAAYAAWTTPVVVPTLELTTHLLHDLDAEPHAGWVLAQQRHLRTGEGTSVDECDLWAPDGRLLATARQLRRVLG